METLTPPSSRTDATGDFHLRQLIPSAERADEEEEEEVKNNGVEREKDLKPFLWRREREGLVNSVVWAKVNAIAVAVERRLRVVRPKKATLIVENLLITIYIIWILKIPFRFFFFPLLEIFLSIRDFDYSSQ